MGSFRRDGSLDFDSYLNLEPTMDSIVHQPGNLSVSPSSLSSRSGYDSGLTRQYYPGPSFPYTATRQQAGFAPGAFATIHASTNSASPLDFHDQEMSAELFPEMTGYDELSPSGGMGSVHSMETSPSGLEFGDLKGSGHSMYDYSQRSTVQGSGFPSPRNVYRSPIEAPLPAVRPRGSQVMGIYPGMHAQAARAAGQLKQQPVSPSHASGSHPSIVPQVRLIKPEQPQRPVIIKEPEDPMVQARISRLLAEMRQRSLSGASDEGEAMQSNAAANRFKKDDDEMDEDERLLASEEGKKLSSKQRRQLRNKVSARAFRSRRKEYITQLESEVTLKMSEMESIRLENIRLKNENRQLTELTRKLLSQPAFSDVLETLAVEIPGTSQPDRDPRSENTRSDILESSKTPKYDTSNSHQIGLAMVPEQTEVGDFSQFYPHSLGGQRLDHPSSWMLQSQVY